MKRLILIAVILSCFFSMRLYAQDIIVKQDGDVIKGYRVEVTDKALYYTDTDSDEADIHRINKADVLIVKKSDGTVLNMNEAPQAQPSNSNAPSSNVVVLTEEQIAEGQKRNQEIIGAFNRDVINYIEEPKKDKKSSHIICQFYADENSVFDDGILQVSYDLGRVNQKRSGEIIGIEDCDKLYVDRRGKGQGEYRDAVRTILTNKSDRMIYIDQALSFFTSEGSSTPYFVPTATSVTEGKTQGGSVNLGGIANAVGVGGALGALAGAVNVGGSTSSSSTTITYSQRILAIPPHSSIALGYMVLHPSVTDTAKKPFVPQRTWNSNVYVTKLTFYIPKTNPLLEGKPLYFDSNNAPMDWGTYIVYGFDENMEQKSIMQQRMYLSKMLGGNFWQVPMNKIKGYDTPGIIWILADYKD